MQGFDQKMYATWYNIVQMYRQSSKKRELIKRIVVYAAMTLSVLIIVTGLVFVTLGYRFDTDNGRVEQGALLQFATIPSGATIKIDGVTIGAKTPAKNSVLAGTHTFVMQRDGYETWQKTVDIKAGTLTWLNYARLVPINRPTTTVAQYTSVYASLASSNGKSMLVQQNSAVPTFQLVDLQSDDIKTTTLTIPATLYSDATTVGVTHSFRIDQWDSDGRYVLLQHSYGDKKEWLVLDTKDSNATKNITKFLDFDIVSAKFSGTSGNILYVLAGSDIRKIDLSAGTISRSLVTNVTSFDLFKTDVLTYVGTDTTNAAKRVVGLYREGDSSPHVLRSVASATDVPLHIATARYFSQDYVAITEGNKVDILNGSYPSSDSDNSSLQQFGTFSFVSGVDRLSFSPSGDYVLVQSGANFASYDIEHKMVTTSVIASDVTAAVGPLKWLDDNYLWSDYNGDVTMREFDGKNSNTINKAVIGQDVVLSQNGHYLYSLNKTDKGFQLQRVRMVLP